jgi:trehalose 6-phosphate synthase
VAEVAPTGAAVLVQDYHLGLLSLSLAERRPDLAAVHFSHTPFATPSWLRVLPEHIAAEVVSGLAAHRACGFHTRGWAGDFLACAREVLALSPTTFVSPLPTDADDVLRAAATPACDAALAEIDEEVGDRRVIARVDRIELSKNLLRGFLSFDDLLDRWPEWRERVVFVASVYPSRTGVPAYLDYQDEVERLVAGSTSAGRPGLDADRLRHPRRLPALGGGAAPGRRAAGQPHPGRAQPGGQGGRHRQRAGRRAVPVPGGGRLGRGGRGRGSGPAFDIAGTADALDLALRMPADERRARATLLRTLAVARKPVDWLVDQLAAAG